MNTRKKKGEEEYEEEGMKRWIWERRIKKMNMRKKKGEDEYEGEGMKR